MKLILTLNVYVRFNLFDHHQRILVAKKQLYFFENNTVQYMTQCISDEIETLQHNPDLVDIWERVEVTVTQCYFEIPAIN